MERAEPTPATPLRSAACLRRQGLAGLRPLGVMGAKSRRPCGTGLRYRLGRCRGTFAASLLRAGAPLERVSVLLGHSSIKVTEKHYEPWVRARQEQLEAGVRQGRVWNSSFVFATAS
jgi:integrase